jgi:hypothetical protein
MANFNGRLTVINSQSSLDNDLLLLAGFSDATQAIFAATQFLLKTKNLVSGQQIIVTGDQGSFGDISVIVMMDAQAAGPQPFAPNLAFDAAAPSIRKTTKTRRSRKSVSKKSASPTRKSGSKAGASKKRATPGKRRKAKSSAKK